MNNSHKNFLLLPTTTTIKKILIFHKNFFKLQKQSSDNDDNKINGIRKNYHIKEENLGFFSFEK